MFFLQAAYLAQRPACLGNASRNAGGQAAVQRGSSQKPSDQGPQITQYSRTAEHCIQV